MWLRRSHNIGYNSTVAFQGHQAESGDMASPSTRPLGPLPASPKRWQSAGTGSSRRHWVLDDGMFSPFIPSSSISAPTTLPIALPEQPRQKVPTDRAQGKSRRNRASVRLSFLGVPPQALAISPGTPLLKTLLWQLHLLTTNGLSALPPKNLSHPFS